jgi:hypothetical protein
LDLWRSVDPVSTCRALQATDAIRHIGLDIDGTITADPPLFAQLASSVLDSGGRIVVITSRSIVARKETALELAGYRPRYSALHFLRSIDEATRLCPHPDLDWFSHYLWCRVAIADDCGVADFVDDDPRVVDLLRRYSPHINAWWVT